jgi:putative Ca2+/H+ antiporter (TMEM165/GDT1 family)
VERSVDGFGQAFAQAFIMILFTELGDETFIIAALLAMRNPRLTVYSGAMTALGAMTVISTALGYALPNLISRSATRHAATVLYFVFGTRLFWIAYKSTGEVKEEIDEVEAKLAGQEAAAAAGRWRKLLLGLLTPVFLEALVLTFLAEWGDRSQIATISLAAQYDPLGVTLGAVAGHALCTGAAVLGGQLLALRISQRTVAVAGGALFFAFMLHNLVTPA